MATLDPDQICSIVFENAASSIAQSLACTGNLVTAEGQRSQWIQHRHRYGVT